MTVGQARAKEVKHDAFLRTLEEMQTRLRHLVSVVADADPELQTLVCSAAESIERIVQLLQSRKHGTDDYKK